LLLKEIANKYNLVTVTEVLSEEHVDFISKNSDILQIGARNMQNFELLKKVAKTKKPIFLKRGFGSLIKEWLLAGEYLAKYGSKKIVFVERGIRTFEEFTPVTLDFSSFYYIKKLTNCPYFIDPSHASFNQELVKFYSKIAYKIKVNGLLIEVHNNPKKAKSDKDHQLTFNNFKKLINNLKNNQFYQ
jgi:3-deoxy-7-phosphoheptulonate synthase